MKRIAYLSILLLAAFVLLFVPAVGAQEDQGVVPVSAYDGYFDPAGYCALGNDRAVDQYG